MDNDLILEIKTKNILHFNARNFSHFPEEIRQFGHLTNEIYFKWNFISSLPPWLGCLNNLTNLYLSFNQLKILPPEISDLGNLEVLYVDNNLIAKLPSSIGELKKLTTLCVSNNELTTIPGELGQLKRLQYFNAAKNYLQILPEILCFCDALEELDFADNRLFYLPRTLVYLQHLRLLNLSNNNLHIFPSLPFVSSPSININFNVDLNYLSYPALHQEFTTFHLDCELNAMNVINRCNEWNITKNGNHNEIHTFCANKNQILYIPQEISRFKKMSDAQQVNSLFELTIRKVYKMYFDRGIARTIITGLIPEVIYTNLERGPVSMCSYEMCRSPIFTEIVAWMSHTFHEHLSHCVFYFCSSKCALSTFIPM